MLFIQESNPWWRVTLEKPLYVESVVITDKIDCCPRDIGMIKVTVSNNQTGDLSCTKSLKYGTTHHYKVRCSPPARGSYVTVTLTGDNITLVLCYVFMRTFGKQHCMYLVTVKLQMMQHAPHNLYVDKSRFIRILNVSRFKTMKWLVRSVPPSRIKTVTIL